MSAKRKPSQKTRVLELLRVRGSQGATSREIARDLEILNHTARMDELRHDGHVIECLRMTSRHGGPAVHRFVLKYDAHSGKPRPLFVMKTTGENLGPEIGGLDAA